MQPLVAQFLLQQVINRLQALSLGEVFDFGSPSEVRKVDEVFLAKGRYVCYSGLFFLALDFNHITLLPAKLIFLVFICH